MNPFEQNVYNKLIQIQQLTQAALTALDQARTSVTMPQSNTIGPIPQPGSAGTSVSPSVSTPGISASTAPSS